jgi:hypothetical protein
MTNRILQDPKQRRLFSSGELKELFTLKEDFDDEDAPNDTADMFSEGVVKESSLPSKKRQQRSAKRGEGRGSSAYRIEEHRDRPTNGEQGRPEEQDDDCKILKALFTGKGLSSVLSHDVVEGYRDPARMAQIEEEAKRVAQVMTCRPLQTINRLKALTVLCTSHDSVRLLPCEAPQRW